MVQGLCRREGAGLGAWTSPMRKEFLDHPDSQSAWTLCGSRFEPRNETALAP